MEQDLERGRVVVEEPLSSVEDENNQICACRPASILFWIGLVPLVCGTFLLTLSAHDDWFTFGWFFMLMFILAIVIYQTPKNSPFIPICWILLVSLVVPLGLVFALGICSYDTMWDVIIFSCLPHLFVACIVFCCFKVNSMIFNLYLGSGYLVSALLEAAFGDGVIFWTFPMVAICFFLIVILFVLLVQNFYLRTQIGWLFVAANFGFVIYLLLGCFTRELFMNVLALLMTIIVTAIGMIFPSFPATFFGVIGFIFQCCLVFGEVVGWGSDYSFVFILMFCGLVIIGASFLSVVSLSFSFSFLFFFFSFLSLIIFILSFSFFFFFMLVIFIISLNKH